MNHYHETSVKTTVANFSLLSLSAVELSGLALRLNEESETRERIVKNIDLQMDFASLKSEDILGRLKMMA